MRALRILGGRARLFAARACTAATLAIIAALLSLSLSTLQFTRDNQVPHRVALSPRIRAGTFVAVDGIPDTRNVVRRRDTVLFAVATDAPGTIIIEQSRDAPLPLDGTPATFTGFLEWTPNDADPLRAGRKGPFYTLNARLEPASVPEGIAIVLGLALLLFALCILPLTRRLAMRLWLPEWRPVALAPAASWQLLPFVLFCGAFQLFMPAQRISPLVLLLWLLPGRPADAWLSREGLAFARGWSLVPRRMPFAEISSINEVQRSITLALRNGKRVALPREPLADALDAATRDARLARALHALDADGSLDLGSCRISRTSIERGARTLPLAGMSAVERGSDLDLRAPGEPPLTIIGARTSDRRLLRALLPALGVAIAREENLAPMRWGALAAVVAAWNGTLWTALAIAAGHARLAQKLLWFPAALCPFAAVGIAFTLRAARLRLPREQHWMLALCFLTSCLGLFLAALPFLPSLRESDFLWKGPLFGALVLGIFQGGVIHDAFGKACPRCAARLRKRTLARVSVRKIPRGAEREARIDAMAAALCDEIAAGSLQARSKWQLPPALSVREVRCTSCGLHLAQVVERLQQGEAIRAAQVL